MSETTNNGYADAIKEIAAMAKEAKDAQVTEINGRTYVLRADRNGNPQYEEVLDSDNTQYPAPMEVNTLNAFIAYIKAGIANNEITDKLYINIESPTFVTATTPVNGYGKRKYIAGAKRYNLKSFDFGANFDFERFIVALRSKFTEGEELKKLLECLSKITKSNELKTEDNGVTQVVTAKQGATLGNIQVSPVWKLRPYRTFTEVEQTESLFLLRLDSRNDETVYALHETDGGAWAIDAMDKIKLYLSAAFKGEEYKDKVFVL